MTHHPSALGAAAEARAAALLTRSGLRVVERNYRCRLGEIDLICRDGTAIVFVEVRARSRADFGGAAASITPAKQRRIVAAARHWLAGKPEPACRFDVVLVDGNGDTEWIRAAFDAG